MCCLRGHAIQFDDFQIAACHEVWSRRNTDIKASEEETLKSLGEILTVHVIGCLWDKQFRNCLVLSNINLGRKFDPNSEFYSPSDERVSLRI